MDGQRLFVLRTSTDHIAPTVYYRRRADDLGWFVVSEPPELGQAGWIELPAGHLAAFSDAGVEITPMADVARVAA